MKTSIVVENLADGIAIAVRTERVYVSPAYLAVHGLRDAQGWWV
jgi:hypothetical protein